MTLIIVTIRILLNIEMKIYSYSVGLSPNLHSVTLAYLHYGIIFMARTHVSAFMQGRRYYHTPHPSPKFLNTWKIRPSYDMEK